MHKAYKTKAGLTQYKPTFDWCEKASHQNRGFCLACASTQGGVEPDARKYVCQACNAAKVYGGEELVLMGLCY